MRVVADASILIHLARIRLLELLQHLYSEVIISSGVFSELVERGWGLPGSQETEEGIKGRWIKVKEVGNKSEVEEIRNRYKIHFANAETVQLATEVKCDIILADELEVRELAKGRGFRVRGCLGILLDGVKQGQITKEESRRKALRLVERGYRASEEVLKEFYLVLEEE